MQTSTPLKKLASAPPGRGRRIAIFVDDLSATGVVRNAVALANRLHSDGWQVCILTSRATGLLKSDVADGVPVRELGGDSWPNLSRSSRLLRSFGLYRRFLKSFQPDVVLSAGNHGHLATVIASKLAPGPRTVFRISNDIHHCTKGRSDRSFAGLKRRLKLRLVHSHADLMVVVSPHLGADPVITRARSAAKITVIPNGVEVEAVRQRARVDCDHPWLAKSAGPPVVLAVGRLVRQKNFKTLLKALAIARETRPLRLLLIGSGPLKGEIEQEAARLGLGECVDIIPPVANPMAYMARAAVMALPSWWEGSSNVLLEAIACGTPVIASETAGNAPTVLADGRYGVLVDPADAGQMASAILRQSSEFAVRPGARAWDFNIDETLDAYSTALADLAGA